MTALQEETDPKSPYVGMQNNKDRIEELLEDQKLVMGQKESLGTDRNTKMTLE